ncbi:MAG TPA: complex I NDUFA9 subunit family protein [Dehalococcoidia bacterium]
MILVAGGTGFVGAAVVRELRARGRPVRVLSRDPGKVERRFPGLGVEAVAGDARDDASLRRAVQGCRVVVSCMQFQGFPVEKPSKGRTFVEVDQHGNERLVAAARDAGVQRYVYLSGSGAAPDAAKVWYRAKWAAEQAIAASGVPFTVFRPSWVYGPEDNALNRFVGFARRLPFVPVIGDGRQRLQPVFVADVAKAVAEALETDAAAGRTYEIGGPEVLTMNEVLRTMLEVMGKRRPLLHSPVFLPKLAGFFLQVLPEPPLSPSAVDFVTADATADNTALLADFRLRLTPLREGLASYLAPGAGP